MTVLFAAGDVGGARALLPVIAECAKQQLPFLVLRHGHIASEAPDTWPQVCLPDNSSPTIRDLLQQKEIAVLVFASSLKDTLALAMARQAKNLGIKVMHILDNWTNYRRRLEMDGLPLFTPDAYLVMDELARDEAIRVGLPGDMLVVSGHPGLAEMSDTVRSMTSKKRQDIYAKFDFTPSKKLLVFISEPVDNDQGSSPDSPSFRGYTEKTVIPLLLHVLQPFADTCQIGLLPHPREDARDLADLLKNRADGRNVKIFHNIPPGDLLTTADGIIGMASILLYEAWLLGKPVVSLQPDVRDLSLRMLEKRPGVTFIDSEKKVHLLAGWLTTLRRNAPVRPRPELMVHHKSPQTSVNLIMSYLQNNNRLEVSEI